MNKRRSIADLAAARRAEARHYFARRPVKREWLAENGIDLTEEVGGVYVSAYLAGYAAAMQVVREILKEEETTR